MELVLSAIYTYVTISMVVRMVKDLKQSLTELDSTVKKVGDAL